MDTSEELSSPPRPGAPDPPPLTAVPLRVLQFVVDRLLVLVPTVVLAVAIVVLAGHILTVLYTAFAVLVVAGWLLETWWPLRHGGQTPAMRWLGLRIVTVGGEPPSVACYLLRTVLLVVDGFLWGLVGLVVMLASPRRQRVGDLVAHTMVVRVS